MLVGRKSFQKKNINTRWARSMKENILPVDSGNRSVGSGKAIERLIAAISKNFPSVSN